MGRHLDRAAVAEVGIGLSGSGVERDQPAVMGWKEDPLPLSVRPVGDSPVLESLVRRTLLGTSVSAAIERQRQATATSWKLSRSIWSRVEYFVLPGSPPEAGQSPEAPV